MPRKRCSRSPPAERRSDAEDDDYYLDEVETMGPWSGDAVAFSREVGAKLRSVSGDPLSKEHFVQRISLAIQRGNAASVLGHNSQEPQHRNAANARERARMRVLSKAFCRLKTTLPWVPADTKLSKLDTLRLAASYIAHLRALLHDEPRTAAQMFPHPLNLAWPFTFQHGGAISCSLTRWSPNSEAACTPSGARNSHIPKESQDYGHTAEQRNHQDYPDGYDREYPDNFDNNPASSGHSYCNYVYKDNYCDVRNTYTENLLNDT